VINLHRMLAIALILGTAWVARAGDDPKGKEPLSEAALIKLAKADIEDDVIVALVKSRGIGFKTDEATMKRLRKAGVSATVLAALPKTGEDKPAKDEDKSADDKPLGTGKFEKGLVIDVTAVKRTSDNFLRVSFQIRNPTKQRITHTISGVYFVPETYYVEAGGKFKYQVVRDDRGNYIASPVPGTITLNPDEKVEYWAKFGQPQKGIKHITLYFRRTEPIEDIPLPPPGK
jgi:hypothetical protein